MDKQTAAYLFNCILINNKKEQTADTYNMENERSQIQESIYYILHDLIYMGFPNNKHIWIKSRSVICPG